MSSSEYCLHRDVRVVYGASRAALYNFRSGVVYSLNEAAAAILRGVGETWRVDDLDDRRAAFVHRLDNLGLCEPVVACAEGSAEPLPDTGPHPLEFLWLELTGSCNLGCAHCYAETQNPLLITPAEPTRSDARSLDQVAWHDLLRQGAELGCRAVQFIGGEALLYRGLLALVNEARRLCYTYIEVFTNGSLLTERVVRGLATSGAQVAVSLHGTTAGTHDAVTRLNGSFERTMAGLRRLREHAVPFRVAGTALRHNQHEILSLPALAQSQGAAYAAFDVVRDIGGGDDPLLAPNDVAVRESKWLSRPEFRAVREQYEHNRRWNPCWAGKLAVTSAGDVMPCVMGRSVVVGNVQEQSLSAILADPRLRAMWALTKDQVAVCRECEYRYVCGDCRPLASAAGDLRGPISRCTYSPRLGLWHDPATGAPRDDPTSQSYEPQLVRVTAPPLHDLLRCEPKERLLPDGDDRVADGRCYTGESEVAERATSSRKSWNDFFQCDPKSVPLPSPEPFTLAPPSGQSKKQ